MWLGAARGGHLTLLALAGALIAFLWRMHSSSEYPSPPSGHIALLTHRDLPSLRQAANALASYGLYVLVGVGSAAMVPHFAETAVKGVELMVVDLQEPSHIAQLVFRSRELTRDLQRPLLGVVMLYPGIMTAIESIPLLHCITSFIRWSVLLGGF